MRKDVVILAAEDDDGHFLLLKRNLRRSGVTNEIVRFIDGEQLQGFLFQRAEGQIRKKGIAYLLILDMRMPKTDGADVLKLVKKDPQLKKIPVLVLTTADNYAEVQRCHQLGCSVYVIKPVEYDIFVDTVKKVGSFLDVVEVPVID